MTYEEFLMNIYTPLKAITLLSDIIYLKCNEDWNMLGGKVERKSGEELIAINYAIKLCAKQLLKARKEEVNMIDV